LMLGDLEDDEALAGADGSRHLARLQIKGLILQRLRERSALERAEVAALSRRGTAGVSFRQVLELTARLNLRQHVVGLRLCLSYSFVIGVCRGRDEDFTEAYLLGLGKVLLVFVVVGLLLSLGHLQSASYLVADDLLRNDAVAN